MNIKELGYLVLDTPSLEAWRRHLRDVVGAMVAEGVAGTWRVRIDERDCRVLLREASAEKLGAIGWLLRDEAEYTRAFERSQAAGHVPVTGSAEECVARRVNGLFWLRDPAGHRHEFAWGPVVNFRQHFVSPVGVPAFVTGEQGMGHLVVTCEPAQFAATSRFLTEALGLKVANFRAQSLGSEPVKFPITWFHADNPRQHSLGLAASAVPGAQSHGCRHINVEVPDIDDVGRALDRADLHGVRIVRSLGRHVNDRAISFYMASPGGFLIEYGCAAPRRDWSIEIAYDEGGAGSLWGHKVRPDS